MSAAAPRRGPAGLARAAIVALARMATRQPHARRLVRELLDRFPALQVRVHGLLGRTGKRPPRRVHAPQDARDLSPGTQALYQELKRHFDARKR